MFRPRLRPLWYNAVLAVALIAMSVVVGAGFYGADPGQRKLLVAIFGDDAAVDRALLVWWVWSVLLVAALLLRERLPLIAAVAAGLGAAGHALDPHFGVQPLDLVLPVVLYTVASRVGVRWISGVIGCCTVIGGYFISLYGVLSATGKAWLPEQVPALIVDAPVPAALLAAASGSFPVLLVLVLAVALGDGARSRRQHLRILQQRASDLERDQQQRSALAAAAERARLVRELHDVVAHGLSVIVIQAQGAAAALHRHPQRAELAIQQVIATGRDALAEMRQLLGVVMHDPGSDVPQAAEPGFGTLATLVASVVDAGLPVRLEVVGDPVPLPPVVDRSVYRIIQESLTNTLKHAGPQARATVTVRFIVGHVEIAVGDNGVGGTTASRQDGHGLRGIAQRVALLRGDLSVGPVDSGGFEVTARLPVTPAPVAIGAAGRDGVGADVDRVHP